MKSVPELRARKAYAESFTTALDSVIIEACSDAIDVSSLRKLLIESTGEKGAVEAGFELELKYYDAAWCYMYSRTTKAMRSSGGIGLFLSSHQRQQRAQLKLISQRCFEGLYVKFGSRTDELIRVMENNAEVNAVQRSRRMIRMTFDDGTERSCEKGVRDNF